MSFSRFSFHRYFFFGFFSFFPIFFFRFDSFPIFKQNHLMKAIPSLKIVQNFIDLAHRITQTMLEPHSLIAKSMKSIKKLFLVREFVARHVLFFSGKVRFPPQKIWKIFKLLTSIDPLIQFVNFCFFNKITSDFVAE